MTSTFHFPPLRAGLLQSLVTLKEQFDADPEFLNQSPYDNEAKAVLSKLFAPKIVETVKEVEVVREVKAGRGRPTKDIGLSAEDQDDVIKEIRDLIKQLNELDAGEKTLDTGERVKIINTKSNLIERLLKMQERIFHTKRIGDFEATIISIVEDYVPEKDRQSLIKRLEPYRD